VTSHLGLMILFAALTSAVFGAIARDTWREMATTALRLFGGFIGVAFLLGWLMYFIPF
jgi:hypothetical protein